MADEAFVSGLLHDVGKILFADRLPEKYGLVLQHAASNHVSTYEAEREILGVTHAEVGAYLLGLWSIPTPIIEVVGFHHNPELLHDNAFCSTMAVCAANSFDSGGNGDTTAGAPPITLQFFRENGLSDRIARWRAKCGELGAQGAAM